MKNLAKIAGLSLILLCIDTLTAGRVLAQNGVIKFDSETIQMYVGDTISKQLVMNTAYHPVSVFDIHVLFDPEHIEILSIENLQGDLFEFHQPPAFNNAEGKIDMAAFQIGKTLPNGDISIAKVTMVALSETPMTTMHHPMTSFPKTLMAYAGQSVLGQTDNLNITILPNEILSDRTMEKNSFGLEIWPNPMSYQTNVSFLLNESEQVKLDIYDVQGNLLMNIFKGLAEQNRTYEFRVDLSDFASGQYYCRLTTSRHKQSKPIVVSK